MKTVSVVRYQEMKYRGGTWTFLSNHSHVLIALSRDPTMRVRDLGMLVGITERAVANLLADLEEAGVLSRERTGRRNTYEIDNEAPLRHPLESHRKVRDILQLAKAEPKRSHQKGAR
jgi:DNA-binding transcriptional ArsR family regulator